MFCFTAFDGATHRELPFTFLDNYMVLRLREKAGKEYHDLERYQVQSIYVRDRETVIWASCMCFFSFLTLEPAEKEKHGTLALEFFFDKGGSRQHMSRARQFLLPRKLGVMEDRRERSREDCILYSPVREECLFATRFWRAT
jgi:hypothetical protein